MKLNTLMDTLQKCGRIDYNQDWRNWEFMLYFPLKTFAVSGQLFYINNREAGKNMSDLIIQLHYG